MMRVSFDDMPIPLWGRRPRDSQRRIALELNGFRERSTQMEIYGRDVRRCDEVPASSRIDALRSAHAQIQMEELWPSAGRMCGCWEGDENSTT
jgi:hypothetical protein